MLKKIAAVAVLAAAVAFIGASIANRLCSPIGTESRLF